MTRVLTNDREGVGAGDSGAPDAIAGVADDLGGRGGRDGDHRPRGAVGVQPVVEERLVRVGFLPRRLLPRRRQGHLVGAGGGGDPGLGLLRVARGQVDQAGDALGGSLARHDPAPRVFPDDQGRDGRRRELPLEGEVLRHGLDLAREGHRRVLGHDVVPLGIPRAVRRVWRSRKQEE